MPSNQTHVALVGCGRWGRHACRDLLELGCRVTVVARSSESKERASEAGAHEIVASIDDLPSVDGAVVCTPTSVHAAVIEQLLDRDLHVFTEKPLCPSVDDAHRIAEHGEGKVFVMDKWRYHPGVEALAALGRSSELGGVVGLRTTRVSRSVTHDDVDAVWVLAPHELAIGLEIFGTQLEPRFAHAEVSAGGGLGGMLAVLGDEPWHVFEVSGMRNEFRREIVLMLEGGVAWLPDSYSDQIAIVRGEAEVEYRPVSADMPLMLELNAFVQFLDGGPPPRSSLSEGVGIVETVAALRDLAQSAAPAAT